MSGSFSNISRKVQNWKKKLNHKEQINMMTEISLAKDFNEVSHLFEKLYDSIFYPLWTNLSKKFIPPLTVEDLEDVIQESWIKVLESRHKYDRESNFYSWIYVINKNSALDKIRKLKKADFNSLDEFSEDDENKPYIQFQANDPMVDDRLIIEETAEIIRNEIDNIEDLTDREVIRRRVIFEQKFEQIAEEMEMPLTTVYKKCKKALDKIKPKIEKSIFADLK